MKIWDSEKCTAHEKQAKAGGQWLLGLGVAHSVGSAISSADVLFSERSRSAHAEATGANMVALADASSTLPAGAQHTAWSFYRNSRQCACSRRRCCGDC